MDINLELYKVFYYVATTLSFSEASRQLFISQSAVSQAVKNLEKKLGHTLFVRSTKRVILTPEGELLLQHVKPALSMLNEGEAALSGEGKSYRSAADRCQRYSVPLFPHPLSPPVPQGSPGSADQDHQQHFHRMCGASGKRPGRTDRHQLPQLPAFFPHQTSDCAGIP